MCTHSSPAVCGMPHQEPCRLNPGSFSTWELLANSWQAPRLENKSPGLGETTWTPAAASALANGFDVQSAMCSQLSSASPQAGLSLSTWRPAGISACAPRAPCPFSRS